MGLRNAMLGAIVATAFRVARSAPQKNAPAVFPIRNDTSAPEPTDAICVADCRVRYPELQAITWVPEVEIVFTTEITVGTVFVYSTVRENSTIPPRTHTVFNVDVPPEYSLWMIRSNGAGTAFVEVPLTISGSHTLKTLEYPTPWLDYPSEYHWEGVLPTTGKRAEPVCATVTELDIGVLDPHPTYPQPKPSLDVADPVGASHKPLWVPIQETPDKSWFDATFPSVSAFASCESVPGKPAPTEFSAPKFIFETTTSMVTGFTSVLIPIIQSSESGFEDTRIIKSTRTIVQPTTHDDATDGVFAPTSESTSRPGPDVTKATGPQFMSTETGFEVTGGHQTARPPEEADPMKTQPPDSIKSIINNNRPTITPMPAGANPTPVFTLVPTAVSGKPFASPAFIIPGTTALASIGQHVTINGQPTVLTAPAVVPTVVPTIINGVRTSVPVYIVSGTITARPGETVVINGQSTVLPLQLEAIYTSITTMINGRETVVPAYIINGSVTARPGEAVEINGQTTVLPAKPDARYTSITTTIDGKETVIPAYIIDGSVTATLGQTVTLHGTTTVLASPTTTNTVDTQFGGPASPTSGSKPQGTGTSSRASVGSHVYLWWEALLLSLGALIVVIL